MTDLYAVSIVARRERATVVTIDHGAGWAYAVSEDEARGMALAKALAVYPTRNGWRDHSIAVRRIDDLAVYGFSGPPS